VCRPRAQRVICASSPPKAKAQKGNARTTPPNPNDPLIRPSQSIGHIPAADRILEATYSALEQLPATHLPANFCTPPLVPSLPPGVMSRVASPVPSGYNTPRARLAPLKEGLFDFCWIALAGMTTPADATAFTPFVSGVLCVPAEKISMTNGEPRKCPNTKLWSWC
jgi:hypothetical protein